MYKQVLDPVGGSLFASAIFAALPLVTLFVLLGGMKVKAHIAAIASLIVAILVAIIVYSMPLGQAADSAILGACFGLFPIMWIVWNAIWIYNMTDVTGHFAVLRRSFASVSDDQRVQAVIIAFSFGALMEALAGFGTPVAITAVMLVALGFRPMKAAAVALVANTAPVAFGAIAIPIVTLAGLTDLPKEDLGAMVGRQTPFLALIVPLVLVGMVDGWRGVRAVWPAPRPGARRPRQDAQPAQVGDVDRDGRARAGLRPEPVGPDHHHRHLDRRRGRRARPAVLDHRLAGRGGHPPRAPLP